MAHRGHSGSEGRLPKACGLVAGVVGLIWVAIVYFFVESGGSSFVLPILLAMAGVITFLAGRSMAKAHAIGRL